MPKFDFVVIKPVKNKPGERVCGYSVEMNTITEAVKHVRGLFEGSGFAVMQAAQFNRRHTEQAPVEDDSNVEINLVG